MQGCPLILQHDNGSEFIGRIVRKLKELWPGCICVRGRPRHPQTQGSIERANSDVQKILGAWMKTHQSKCWSIGIHWVAWTKNNRYHHTTMYTPYQLQYGQMARNKMLNLPLDPHLLSSLETETELLKHHKFEVSESEGEEDNSDEDNLIGDDNAADEEGVVLTKILLDVHPNSFTQRRRKALVEDGVTLNVLQSRVPRTQRLNVPSSEDGDEEEENVGLETIGTSFL